MAVVEHPLPRAATHGAEVDARVLGGFAVTCGGRTLSRTDWRRASAERLVKMLLVTPSHRLSREAAAEMLWPGADPESSRVNLRKAIHFASRALGDSGPLAASNGWLSLDPARLRLDLDRLRAAFDQVALPRAAPATTAGGQVRTVDCPEIAGAVDVILELGSAELLPDDPFEDWLAAPREHLRGRWQAIAIVAARRARDLGNVEQAQRIADQLLDRDPTDEAAHRLVIEMLAAAGRHHAVRRQFELCRQALRTAFDIGPSPETEAAFRTAEQAADRAEAATVLPRLVARRPELAQIESLLGRVNDGHVETLAIHGPTGIGKSRLLHEVADYARSGRWRVLEWRAVEAARGSAYGPLGLVSTAGLTAAEMDRWSEPARSAIATVSPGLDATPSGSFRDRAALVDGLVLAIEQLARPAPLALVIDDLPWLDESTIELLGCLLAGPARGSILIAATCRDDEPIPDPVRRLLEQMRRAGGTDIALGPLTLADVEPLVVGALGGSSVDPDVVHAAFDQSAGNPLFCLELVRTGRDHGTLRLVGERWMRVEPTHAQPAPSASHAFGWLPETPETVRRLVANRSARLSGPTLELVGAAAELGAEFSFGALEAILPALDGGLVAALDAAIAAGLLTERGGGYEFAHPLYRLAVRGSAGSARRAETHLSIASALAGCRPSASPTCVARAVAASVDPLVIADHALTATELGATAALPFAVAAGFAAASRALRLFDPVAEVLLERSVAAWRRLPAELANQVDASVALTSLANLRMNAGDDATARARFRDAAAAARTPEELARVYRAWCWLPYRHGDFEGALAILQEAMARLPGDAAAARATVESGIGWILGRLHRLDEAIDHLSGAARTLEACGEPVDTMTALDQLGMMLEMVHRSDEAIERLERSLAIALAGDVQGERVRIHLGVALTRSGQPGLARLHIERGLELAHQMGDRYLEAVGAWGAAEMEDALGNYEAARAMRLRELGLLASIGGNTHNEALSHAHLAHLAHLMGDAEAATCEATTARQLAATSPDGGYAARIEEALSVERWSDLETG